MTTITHSAGVITPRLVIGWETSRPVRTIVHSVLGRTDPDITLRGVGLRAGTLRLLFSTGAEATAAGAVFATPQTLTLTDTDVPAIGMAFVVAGGDLAAQLDPETRRLWTLAVPFQEVAP